MDSNKPSPKRNSKKRHVTKKDERFVRCLSPGGNLRPGGNANYTKYITDYLTSTEEEDITSPCRCSSGTLSVLYCYYVVTLLLFCCYSAITLLLLCCYSFVTLLLFYRYSDVTLSLLITLLLLYRYSSALNRREMLKIITRRKWSNG